MRDKYKKEYDYYMKKTTKMKLDREAKKAKNPMNIETAKEVEWYLRNDRKLETARSNFITISQQSYVSAKEFIKLLYDYMMPILDIFAKSLLKFFNGTGNAVMTLSEISDQIEKAKKMQQDRDTEEKLRELRKEEEKLRRLQETRNQLEREKREREQQEQEKLQQELEKKRRELLSECLSNQTPDTSPQTYKHQDLKDTFPQDQGLRSTIKYVSTKDVNAIQSNYYPTADSLCNPKAEFNFYSQPKSKGHYGQVRAKGSSFMFGSESYNQSYGKEVGELFCEQTQNDEWEDSTQTAYHNVHAYAKPPINYQESSGKKKPRNPFLEGSYTRSTLKPPLQNDQFNFFS